MPHTNIMHFLLVDFIFCPLWFPRSRIVFSLSQRNKNKNSDSFLEPFKKQKNSLQVLLLFIYLLAAGRISLQCDATVSQVVPPIPPPPLWVTVTKGMGNKGLCRAAGVTAAWPSWQLSAVAGSLWVSHDWNRPLRLDPEPLHCTGRMLFLWVCAVWYMAVCSSFHFTFDG